MIKDMQKRGWKFTRRNDAVVKIRHARDLANWLQAKSGILERYQVTESRRLVNRIENFSQEANDEELQKKLTRAVQQFVTHEQWVKIRQHFYKFKRQKRDGVKVIAVSKSVWSDLNQIKNSNDFGSMNEVIDDLLSYREAAMKVGE